MSVLKTTPDDGNKGDAVFVARVRQIIELVGGISALARRCQLSRGVIYKYLNGESEPSRPRLIAMAKAAGVSLECLATGAGAMQEEPVVLPEPDSERQREMVALQVQ